MLLPRCPHPLSMCLLLKELLAREGGVHAAGQRRDAHSGGGGRAV